jgi:hypothetical protein
LLRTHRNEKSTDCIALAYLWLDVRHSPAESTHHRLRATSRRAESYGDASIQGSFVDQCTVRLQTTDVMVPWVLVSPASRGIGLALARHILRATKAPLVATARSDLEGTKSMILEGLEAERNRLDVLEVDFLGETDVFETASPALSLNGL